MDDLVWIELDSSKNVLGESDKIEKEGITDVDEQLLLDPQPK